MHQSSGSTTHPVASKPKVAIPIFLVDDHTVVREGIRRLLELEGDVVIVGEADSAEEALTQLRYCAPKVVLMDIRLPGISGIEATRHIKAQHPDLRVLILSAFGDEHLAQAIEAGADGYVLKTTKRAELMEAVRRALGVMRSLIRTLQETFWASLPGYTRTPRFRASNSASL